MSEEILKALMQLFAIIAKQDGGVKDSEIDFVAMMMFSASNSVSPALTVCGDVNFASA